MILINDNTVDILKMDSYMALRKLLYILVSANVFFS